LVNCRGEHDERVAHDSAPRVTWRQRWVDPGAGQVEERATVYFNLSFDHQAIDRAPATRFLQTVKQHQELPVSLVL
jgi:pyruvate/2-oxoglutarate dehydrogenase complex dihydrolipoamide acyltransferase (E2) component